MCQKAVYPGTFDPPTYGHMDVIERALKIFPELIVAVADNPHKESLFSITERLKMLKEATAQFGSIEIQPFKGLVVDFVRANKAKVIIRGLRMVSDFEYEFQMALTNRKIAPDLETIFLMPSENFSYISSRLLKEAASLGADLSSFLPPYIEDNLKKHLKK